MVHFHSLLKSFSLSYNNDVECRANKESQSRNKKLYHLNEVECDVERRWFCQISPEANLIHKYFVLERMMNRPLYPANKSDTANNEL